MPATTDSSPWLVHQWTIAGIVAAAARFIPVPFVDELVQSRCRRFAIKRTLETHKSELDINDFAVFYGGSGGCLAGCYGLILRAPIKILLFPLRKIVMIFTSIRGVPLEIMRTVLMGRSLERCLQSELLTEPNINSTELTLRSLQMRNAFDEAFARMDWRAVRAAIRDALASVDDWKSAAVSSARRMLNSDEAGSEELESESAVEAGAEQIEQVLRRPEVLELFAEFDRRFDDALARIRNA